MYIVVAGRLRIFAVASDGTEVAIREIGRGEPVGELDLRGFSKPVRAFAITGLGDSTAEVGT